MPIIQHDPFYIDIKIWNMRHNSRNQDINNFGKKVINN